MAFTPEQRAKSAATRQANAAAKLTSTGFGESKIFAAPEGTFEIDARLPNCHIEGKLISEHYSEEQMAALRWAWTDEGFAANNEGKSELRVSVSNPVDKQREHRRDDILDRGMETWEAHDPMKEVADQYKRPGFRNRFLSDNVVKSKGTRGWQPVVNGGDPVKLGGMVLAEMPEEKARVRNAHYREKGNRLLAQVQEEYMNAGGKTAIADQ